CFVVVWFFFSSRRRHTRWPRDWSSDVCSSDLIVTLVPGTGDEVQALKAGIMEIADIFVVNKADREGAERLASAVEANLALHHYRSEERRVGKEGRARRSAAE